MSVRRSCGGRIAGRELASAGVIAPDEPLVTDGREVYENVEGQLFLILNDEAQAVESGEPLCVNFHLGLVHPRTGEYMEFGLPTDTMAVSDLGGFVDVSLGYGSSPRDIAEALVKAEPQFLGVDFLASAPHAMNFVYNLRIGKPANIKPKEFSEAVSKLISQNLKAWSVDCVFDVVEHEVTYGTDEGLSLESSRAHEVFSVFCRDYSNLFGRGQVMALTDRYVLDPIDAERVFDWEPPEGLTVRKSVFNGIASEIKNLLSSLDGVQANLAGLREKVEQQLSVMESSELYDADLVESNLSLFPPYSEAADSAEGEDLND